MNETKSIDARAAAERLGMELRTLERLRGRGDGPVPWKATDLQNSKVRYEIAELDAWVARRRMRKSVSSLVTEVVERVLDLERTIPTQTIASESWLAQGRLEGAQEIMHMLRDFETPLPALGTERGSTDG